MRLEHTVAMKTCAVNDCSGRTVGRGYCTKHYQRLLKYGTTDPVRPTQRDRLATKFTQTEGCWTWHAAKDRNGYGVVLYDGRAQRAHRAVYQEWTGRTLRPDLVLDHLCRNPACVNPDHLEEVSQGENMRRGNITAHQKTKTHCAQGHPYEGFNLMIRKNGGRDCRACNYANKAKRKIAS